MYASRQMSQIDIVFWSLDIGKCLDMTLAYWSLDLGRCHSQMSRHPYRSQMGAAKMPPQAHVCTQYTGWGGRMDSPARSARAAQDGFRDGDLPADRN